MLLDVWVLVGVASLTRYIISRFDLMDLADRASGCSFFPPSCSRLVAMQLCFCEEKVSNVCLFLFREAYGVFLREAGSYL